jgi:hypothetical protein
MYPLVINKLISAVIRYIPIIAHLKNQLVIYGMVESDLGLFESSLYKLMYFSKIVPGPAPVQTTNPSGKMRSYLKLLLE